LWQTEEIFEKPVQTVAGMIHAQLPEPKKVSFGKKYHVLMLMNHSEDHKIGHVIRREYWL